MKLERAVNGVKSLKEFTEKEAAKALKRGWVIPKTRKRSKKVSVK